MTPVFPGVLGGSGEYLVDLDSLAALRDTVARKARRCGLPERAVDDLTVVANELATNVVRHGGGVGRMRLWCQAGHVFCQVSDEGPGFAGADRAGVAGPDPAAVTGRGLWLVRQMSEGVRIDSGPGGTTVTAAVGSGPRRVRAS